MTRRHSASDMSTNGAAPVTPALANTESTLPSSSSVRAIAAETCASSATSQRTPIARPSSAHACAVRSSSRAHTATVAPAATRPCASPSPRPRLPPVTTAT